MCDLINTQTSQGLRPLDLYLYTVQSNTTTNKKQYKNSFIYLQWNNTNSLID